MIQGCSYTFGKTQTGISQVYTAGSKDLCVFLCDADSRACIWLQVQFSSSPLHPVLPWEEIQVCRKQGCLAQIPACLITEPRYQECTAFLWFFYFVLNIHRTKMIPNQRGSQTKTTERRLNGSPWWELNANSTLTNGTCLMSQRATNVSHLQLQYNSITLPLTLLLDKYNSKAMKKQPAKSHLPCDPHH